MATRTSAHGDSEELQLVPVAEIARPHGLRGELRLKVYNPDSALLESRPPVWLRGSDGPAEPCELASVRSVSGGVLIRLPGVDDRDGAAALRGMVLCVTRDALAATDPDEYYVCDLAGCTARVGDQEIGQVVDVATYPTCDALVIRRPDGTELQVPMHEDFVAAVRIADHAVDLRTIEGLE